MSQLREADFSRLKALLAQLNGALDTCSRAVEKFKRAVKKKKAEERSEFDDAYAQVRARESALRNSIEAAQRASATEAERFQARVAEDYEAYSRAVIVAESLARQLLNDAEMRALTSGKVAMPAE
jgi:hypothetical protein